MGAQLPLGAARHACRPAQARVRAVLAEAKVSSPSAAHRFGRSARYTRTRARVRYGFYTRTGPLNGYNTALPHGAHDAEAAVAAACARPLAHMRVFFDATLWRPLLDGANAADEVESAVRLTNVHVA